MKTDSVQGLPRLILLGTLGLLVAAPWSGAAGREPQGTSLWAGNRGEQPIEVQVERSWNGGAQTENLLVSPGEIVPLERWDAREKIVLGEDRDLFLISASAHFDGGAVKVQESLEPAVEAGPERGRGLGILKAAANGVFARGQEAAAATVWGGAGALTLDLSLRQDSAAEVRLKRADGALLGFVDVGSTRAVKLRLDLASLAGKYRGPLRADLKVHTGRAEAALASERGETVRFQAVPVLKYTGNADYSPNINWSWNPTLYYYITGGPANEYGDLFVRRNGGSWEVSLGWLQTNGSGNATKGPWYWSSGTADEYAEAYIRWQSSYTTTNTDWHIWDRTCPSITRTSPSGAPPTSFQGSATDGSNGACFRSSHSWVRGTYRNTTNGLYWNGSSYGSSFLLTHDGWISGMPGCSVTWSINVPPSGAHVAGNCYEWKACIYDGGCDKCTTLTFCK